MKTRKELLVELVAGLGSWMTTAGKIAHASELLAEIEKVCPATFEDFDVAQAVAAQREKDAKIAEDEHHDAVAERIAAAIRRGGA